MIDLDYDVVPHLFSGIVERAKPERARENHSTREKATRGGDHIFLSPRRVSPFWRGVIFTHARVSLALLSLRTNG